MSDKELRNLREGLYFCTNCYRCTGVCPAGINLQDLWFNARENLLHKSDPEFLTLSPLSLYRGLKREDIKSGSYEKPMAEVTKALSTAYQPLNGQVIHFGSVNKRFKKQLSTLPNADTYVYCFTCKTCTSACPVVNNFENPPEALGLVPHQILAALHMGLSDPVLGSDMLWSCLGCYQCQDSCPQGVKVTDLLYALKNLAMEQQMNGKTKKTSG